VLIYANSIVFFCFINVIYNLIPLVVVQIKRLHSTFSVCVLCLFVNLYFQLHHVKTDAANVLSGGTIVSMVVGIVS